VPDAMAYFIELTEPVPVQVRHFNLKPIPSCDIDGVRLVPVTPAGFAIGHTRPDRLLDFVDDDHKFILPRHLFRGSLPKQGRDKRHTWVVDMRGLGQIIARTRMPLADQFWTWACENIFGGTPQPADPSTTTTTTDTPDPDEDDMTDETKTSATDDSTTDEDGATDAPFVETEIIPFTGSGLQVIKKGCGGEAIVLRPACEDMGLRFNGQLAKLKTQPWAVVQYCCTTGADGKTYRMATLDVEHVPMWLATIDANRCNEKSRPIIVAYQKHATKVLYDYYDKLARGGPPTGPSLDMEALVHLFGEGIAKVMQPVARRLDVIDRKSEFVMERIRNLEDMVLRIDANTSHGSIDYDALLAGRRMILHDWADENQYQLTGAQMQHWGISMKNQWEMLGLTVEKRWLKNGKSVNVYPEGGIRRLFNICAPRDVWINRGKGGAGNSARHQEFPFRNGSHAR
jgi:hypothetical protein